MISEYSKRKQEHEEHLKIFGVVEKESCMPRFSNVNFGFLRSGRFHRFLRRFKEGFGAVLLAKRKGDFLWHHASEIHEKKLYNYDLVLGAVVFASDLETYFIWNTCTVFHDHRRKEREPVEVEPWSRSVHKGHQIYWYHPDTQMKWDPHQPWILSEASKTSQGYDTIWEVVTSLGLPSQSFDDRDPRESQSISGGTSERFGYKFGYEYCVHHKQRASERTIQTLEDMLRACAIDFGKAKKTTVKSSRSTQRNEAARDRQKSYADLKHKPMEFQVGDKVMLKVSPWKGVVRFGKRGKLNPRFMRRTISVLVGWTLSWMDKLHFVEEPVEIMGQEVKRLKRSRIPLVKVRWNSKRGPEFTWEREDQFKKKYPHLFTKTTPSSSAAL
ncbi:hypothetical protein Tco_0728136 [Tanacetum coccineum]|uniref:Reverse transcriptase domain-containing protein n=1 Tax=Tanacetum coccineum TaxID=301880 RepID=A0ABQ4YKU9_9ASTR